MKRLILLLTFILGITASSFAQLNASATLTWTQSGSNYTYNITLKNTGTTTIGDFFFAWVPGEDFLPTMPTAEGDPAGWTNSPPNHGYFNDGYGINWSASTPLAAGQSLGGFTFTTTDTPTEVLGNSPYYTGTPVGTSYVYVQTLEGDPGKQLVVTGPPKISLTAVSMNPAGVVGGASSTGTVTLSGAPSADTAVSLSSDNAAVTVPTSATVLSTATSASFHATTKGVSASVTAHITAKLNGVSKIATMVVNKASLSAIADYGVTSVSGGASINAIVELNGLAPATPATVVALHSSNSVAASVPASVTIPPGMGFKVFSIVTQPVSANTAVTLSANYSGVTRTVMLTVSDLRLNYLVDGGVTSIIGGKTLSASAYLSVRPTSNVSVTLKSSNTSVATVPASVIVPSGGISSAFFVTTKVVQSATPVTITGSYAGVSRTLTVTVEPPAPTALLLPMKSDLAAIIGARQCESVLALNLNASSFSASKLDVRREIPAL